MNPMLPALQALTLRTDIHLEDYLEILSHAGNVVIGQLPSKEWCCSVVIESKRTETDNSITITSRQATPMEAAKQCLERVVAALQ